MIYTGGGDFKRIGKIQLGYFQQYCGLKPESHVLDIGSGMGRSAVALTSFLNEIGRYEGFDVVKRGVDWCKRNITSRFSNFRFQYIPLNNDLYRQSGEAPEKFRFPYPDRAFDLIIVNSVFTHMVAEEVAHYFSEMSRVIKEGGIIYATFFLYTENAENFPKGFSFPFDLGDYRLMDKTVKSANVAYKESYLKRELVQKNGFTIKYFFRGSWWGNTEGGEGKKEFQDLVILEKVGQA